MADTDVFHPNILLKSSYLSIISSCLNFTSIILFSYEIYKAVKGNKKFTINSLNLLTIIIVLGIVVEFYTRFDIYYFFTGGRPLPLEGYYDRPRGFSFEPRGAVQCLTMILCAQLLVNYRKSFYLLTPFIVWGIFLPVSLSGLVIGTIVLTICLIYFITTLNKTGVLKVFYLCLLCVLTYKFSGRATYTDTHIRDRSYLIKPRDKQPTQHSWLSKLANRLEVSDGAYINFLDNNPKYWIFGTGIMSVNATRNWVLEKDRDLRIEYIGNPFLGTLFLHSMFGILSLFFLGAVLYRLIRRQNWHSNYHVLFNMLLIVGSLTYFYVLPFLLIACFEFSKKLFHFTKETAPPHRTNV